MKMTFGKHLQETEDQLRTARRDYRDLIQASFKKNSPRETAELYSKITRCKNNIRVLEDQIFTLRPYIDGKN